MRYACALQALGLLSCPCAFDLCAFDPRCRQLLRKGVRRMVAVVMEPGLRDTKAWTGVVGAKFGTSLYCDCSDNETTASFAQTVEQLAGEIRARSIDNFKLTASSSAYDLRDPLRRGSLTNEPRPNLMSLTEPLSHYWTATSHT